MSAPSQRPEEKLRLKDTPAADDLEKAENVFVALGNWVRRKF